MPRGTYLVQVEIDGEWRTVRVFSTPRIASELATVLREAGHNSRNVTPTKLRYVYGYSPGRVQEAMENVITIPDLEKFLKKATKRLEEGRAFLVRFIPEEVFRELVDVSKDHRTTLNSLIVSILEEWVAKRRREK